MDSCGSIRRNAASSSCGGDVPAGIAAQPESDLSRSCGCAVGGWPKRCPELHSHAGGRYNPLLLLPPTGLLAPASEASSSSSAGGAGDAAMLLPGCDCECCMALARRVLTRLVHTAGGPMPSPGSQDPTIVGAVLLPVRPYVPVVMRLYMAALTLLG